MKHNESNGCTHIVDKRDTLHVKVFPVEGVLQQLDDIVANGVLCGEALGPRENLPLIQCGLFDGEAERESKGDSRFLRKSG